MPVRHARSETRRCPPCGRREGIGNSGSTRANNGLEAVRRSLPVHATSPNRSHRPFVWTATADSILDKLARLCSRISETQHSKDRNWRLTRRTGRFPQLPHPGRMNSGAGQWVDSSPLCQFRLTTYSKHNALDATNAIVATAHGAQWHQVATTIASVVSPTAIDPNALRTLGYARQAAEHGLTQTLLDTFGWGRGVAGSLNVPPPGT